MRLSLESAINYTAQRLWQRMGWFGILRLFTAMGICTAAGFIIARVVGFPLYPGWQGVFVQQPVHIAAMGLAGAVVSLLLGLIVSLIIAPPVDMRMPAVVAATALLGFSIRGGTMGSVMQAAGGREIFWLLAVELAVLTLLVMLIAVTWRALRGSANEAPGAIGTVGLGSGGVQFLATAAMLWVLGQNYQKPQALLSVLFAAGIGTWVAHFATGHIWRWAWVVPMIVGIAGYVINAVWATGVDVATIPAAMRGFSAALPLDYAAMGALGVVLGTLVAHAEMEDMPGSSSNEPKVASQE